MNRGPIACKASALPAELCPHVGGRSEVNRTLEISLPKRVVCHLPTLRNFWWRVLDSDQRAFYRTGLQPVTFNHSVNPPKIYVLAERQRLELWRPLRDHHVSNVRRLTAPASLHKVFGGSAGDSNPDSSELLTPISNRGPYH